LTQTGSPVVWNKQTKEPIVGNFFFFDKKTIMIGHINTLRWYGIAKNRVGNFFGKKIITIEYLNALRWYEVANHPNLAKS
jgi:hypothetical protein